MLRFTKPILTSDVEGHIGQCVPDGRIWNTRIDYIYWRHPTGFFKLVKKTWYGWRTTGAAFHGYINITERQVHTTEGVYL